MAQFTALIDWYLVTVITTEISPNSHKAPLHRHKHPTLSRNQAAIHYARFKKSLGSRFYVIRADLLNVIFILSFNKFKKQLTDDSRYLWREDVTALTAVLYQVVSTAYRYRVQSRLQSPVGTPATRVWTLLHVRCWLPPTLRRRPPAGRLSSTWRAWRPGWRRSGSRCDQATIGWDKCVQTGREHEVDLPWPTTATHTRRQTSISSLLVSSRNYSTPQRPSVATAFHNTV